MNNELSTKLYKLDFKDLINMGFNDKAERIIENSGEVDLEGILEQAEELRVQLENEDFEEYEDNLEDL